MHQLIVLLNSGLSLHQALEVLHNHYSTHRLWLRFLNDLNDGVPFTEAVRYFFSWWCPYPFVNVSIAVDTIQFLSLCESYLSYRRSNFRYLVSNLAYPLFLLLMSSIIVIALFHHPQLVSSVHWIRYAYATIAFVYIVFMMMFAYLFYITIIISPYDILELMRTCLNQGWSLLSIFESLSFSFILSKKWARMITNASYQCSFVASFQDTFRITHPLIDALQMYESAGNFQLGLNHVLPFLQDDYQKQFQRYCRALNIGLYAVIICLICSMVFLIYFPMMSQHLR